jgi:hypothetical protein
MKCIRKGCKNKAIIDRVYGVLPCSSCQKKDEEFSIHRKPPEFYSLSRMDRVTRQRDKHSKDMIPVWWKNKPNPEFAKAFPNKAREFYTKEELSKL